MAITIHKLIDIFDERYPNAFSYETKASWVMACDSEIYSLCHHLHPIDDYEFNPEDYKDEEHTVILGDEWIDIYIDCLMAKIHYTNGEYDKANNCTLSYNNGIEKYQNHLRANNMPCKQDRIVNIWGRF